MTDELNNLGECMHCMMPCGKCPDVIRSRLAVAENRGAYILPLRAALRRYGDHLIICEKRRTGGDGDWAPCTCGFDDIREQLL